MFKSISRGHSRFRPSYICTTCLASILLHPAHLSLQLLGIESFSTTSSHCQTENNEASTTIETKKKLSRRRRNPHRSAVGRTQTTISESKRTLSVLRESLIAEDKATNAASGKYNVRKQSKVKAPKNNNEQDGDKVQTSNSTGLVDGVTISLPPGPKSVKAKNGAKKTSAKGNATGRKTKMTTSNVTPFTEKDGENQAENALEIRRTLSTTRTGTLSTLLATSRRERARAELFKPSSIDKKTNFGNKMNNYMDEIGQNPTKQALVKIIEDGNLSETDTLKAVRELRSMLIQRVPSGASLLSRSISSKGLAAKLKEYKTIKDAIQNKPLRSRLSSSRNSKTTARIDRSKVKIKTGPMKEKRGFEIKTIDAAELELTPIERPQPQVPHLSYGLERVLFNPGVYHLQDPRSRVFNFDPYLQTIMPVTDFDFTALKQYITSSRDDTLLATARVEHKKYTGSTSSMTAALAHFHFLLSQWRPVNTGTLSQNFPVEFNTFTALQRGPSAVFLKWKDGVYAIDADKQFDTANILSMLGKSMEKLLTLPTEEFEKYRKQNSDQITEEERNEAEAFHYTTLGDFLLRSQLDAHDPRLPGSGMFDLKTRAVVSIRMDTSEYEQGVGYEIRGRHGEWESFEREYYDMIRAAFLKYSLQVRMGRMDGIFVAFHNTERIFGFQYISLPEMDYALHGTEDTTIGDSEFKLSLELLNKVLDRATSRYPEKSLRLHFETRGVETPFMYIFAEPVEEEKIQEIQESNKAAVDEFEQRVLGLDNGKTEEELLEDKKNAEWEILRARVEESMERDELDIEEARAIAESMIEDSEIFGSDAVSAEEKERRVNELLDEAFSEDDEGLVNEEDGDNFADEGIGGIVESPETEDADEDDQDGEDVEDGDEGEGEDEEDEEDEDGQEVDDGESGEIEQDLQEETLDAIGKNEPRHMAGEIKEFDIQTGLEDTETDGNGVEDESSENADSEESEDISNNTELVENQKPIAYEAAKKRGLPYFNISQKPARGHPEHETGVFDEASTVTQADISAAEIKIDNGPEVLAMTLTIRNKVNGKYVDRPKNLRSGDKWTIEYSLADAPVQFRARLLYEACKRRRSTILSNSKKNDNNAWNNQYLGNLRKLSQKGREWRQGQNKIDQARPLKILEVKDGTRIEKTNMDIWSGGKD